MSAGARSTVPCAEHGAARRREGAARAALEDRYGRPLSDAEWKSAKRDLLAFVRLLAEWDGRAGDRNGSGNSSGVLGPTGLLL